MTTEAELWNSLETTKILVAVLTPVTVVIIGFWISSRLKRLDHLQWMNHKVIERRLRLFDEMSPGLNSLFCYFYFVGSWNEYTPEDIVALKRKLDRLAHVNSPLFSREFLALYHSFINTCFETYTGWGNTAKLRTGYSKRKDACGDNWNPSWESCFSNKGIPGTKEVKDRYTRLMNLFSTDFGIASK